MQIKTIKNHKKKTNKKLIKKRIIRSKYQKGGAAAAAATEASAGANSLKPYKFSPHAVNTTDLFAKALSYCGDASRNFQGIIGLINEIYPAEQLTKFKLDVSITDPFLQQIIPDADYYNRWYREKLGIPAGSTKELKLMSHHKLVDTLQIPEFKTLLAQIARDCLIMLITSRRNLDNQYRLGNNKISNIKVKLEAKKELLEKNIDDLKTQLHRNYKGPDEMGNPINRTDRELTKKLEKNIRELDKINNELSRFEQYNKNNNKSNEKKLGILTRSIDGADAIRYQLNELLSDINTCIGNSYIYSHILMIIIKFIIILSDDDYNLIERLYYDWLDTPYIFFPTYQSINFQTVIALISAPIINFRLSNRTRAVHSRYESIIFDVRHDIYFHARKTHRFTMRYKPTFYYRDYFNTMNKLLKLLFPYYYCTDCTQETDKKEYAQELVNYDDLIENNKKNVISLLLFTILHEMLQITGRSEYNLNYNFKDYIYKLDKPETKMEIIKHLKDEVSNNMFDRKYPFVSKLDWNSVVEAFIEIINELNKDNNKYDVLVDKLPEPL